MAIQDKINILLVEDNEEILDVIKIYLPQNYNVFVAKDGSRAIDLFDNKNIDIIVLDLMLPIVSGYEVLKYIREKSDVPIMILSAKKLEHEIIIGLNKGADDYMTKPFSPLELMARIDVLVRRFCNKEKNTSKNMLVSNDLLLDLDSCVLKKNGKIIDLTGKEFKLIHFFMENKGLVFTKNQLMEKLWSEDCFDDNAVAVYINRLREKIEDNPKNPKYIITIRGLGYKFYENN